MAYTSVIPVHRLKGSVDYVLDEKKRPAARTQNLWKKLWTMPSTGPRRSRIYLSQRLPAPAKLPLRICVKSRRCGIRTGGVQGFHLVQSFAAGEVTPELAHQIGLEFAGQLLQGKYQAVVSTHLNTGHIHNHIVWNSVAIQDGKKVSQQRQELLHRDSSNIR